VFDLMLECIYKVYVYMVHVLFLFRCYLLSFRMISSRCKSSKFWFEVARVGMTILSEGLEEPYAP